MLNFADEKFFPIYPDMADLSINRDVLRIIGVLSQDVSGLRLTERESFVYEMFRDIATDFTKLEHLQVKIMQEKKLYVPYAKLSDILIPDEVVKNPGLSLFNIRQKIAEYIKNNKYVEYNLQLEILQKLLQITDPFELDSLYTETKNDIKAAFASDIWPQFIIDFGSRNPNQFLGDGNPIDAVYVGLYLLTEEKGGLKDMISKIEKPSEIECLQIGSCLARGADATTQSNSAMVVKGGVYVTIPEFVFSNQWYLTISNKESLRLGLEFDESESLLNSLNMLLWHESGHKIRYPRKNKFGRIDIIEDIYSEYFADANAVLYILNKIESESLESNKLKYLISLCSYYDIDISDFDNELTKRRRINIFYEYSISKIAVWRMLVRSKVVQLNPDNSVKYCIERENLENFKKLILSQRDNPKDLRIKKAKETPETLYENYIMTKIFN